ncbi:MAG: hypothetical protein ACK491_14010 [Pseudanabaena sp.]
MTTATLAVKSNISDRSGNTYTHKVREFSAEDKTTTLELLKQYRKAPSIYLRDRLVRLISVSSKKKYIFGQIVTLSYTMIYCKWGHLV